MRSFGGEPDWAPYAVLLYSAFHDFASNLVENFGLPAKPLPNEFSFGDATGQFKSDVQNATDDGTSESTSDRLDSLLERLRAR